MKLAQLYRKYKVLIYCLESLYVIIVHVSAVLDSDWLVMVLKCQKKKIMLPMATYQYYFHISCITCTIFDYVSVQLQMTNKNGLRRQY